MRRGLSVALVVLASLLGTAGAQAKAPPDGVDVCGATGACVHLSALQAESDWALWSTGSQVDGVGAPAASGFFVLRWHRPSSAEQTAYYVPAAGKVRQLDENGAAAWWSLRDPVGLRRLTADLPTFAVPRIKRVTVAGRRVRDPQSYTGLFGTGHASWLISQPRWLPVRITADAPSPWTDEATDVRVSRSGAYLWIDGTVFKIPRQLAQRIRRGASLRG
jgi:hypothetical protein